MKKGWGDDNHHGYLTMDILQFPLLAVLLLQPTTQYDIGFLINDAKLNHSIQSELEDVNEDTDKFNITQHVLLLSSDPLTAATDICEQLITKGIYAIVSTNAINSSKPPHIVSHIAGFYKIPVIAIEARHSELSDKKSHPTILRTVPPYFDEARGWANMIRSFKWNKVNLVAGNDYDGRLTYIKFTTLAYRYNIVIEHPIMFTTGKMNLTDDLYPLKTAKSKIVVLACSEKDAINVFKSARGLGIMEYIWISNQNAITTDALDYSPQGLVALRLRKEKSQKSHLKDAIKVLAKTFEKLHSTNQRIDSPPSSCNTTSGKWLSGDILYRSFLNNSFEGSTGTVEFDWYGDRTHSSYLVFNVQNGTTKLKQVGILHNGIEVDIKKEEIIWPGNRNIDEKVSISNHLRIVTVKSTPFVYVTDLPKSRKCSDKNYLDPVNKKEEVKYLPCTDKGKKNCCKGLCMDLLTELATRVNFSYEIYLSGDGKFGSLTKENGSSIKKWDGAISEIVERKADLIVASLTINNERAQYIEFSKPFKHQGITILVKKNEVQKKLFSFLQPFELGLWLLVLLSVHLIAVILYVLDRFSPFGRYKLTQSNKEEAALDLSSAMWFSWGVLLNSGIGEGTPRSFSARVLGMVWAAFAMVIIASYTANLAAFLVLDRPKAVVAGVDDPALRNPSDDYKYGTVKKSSVNTYFRKKVELSNMYTFMQKYNVDNESEGIAKVNNGELTAFVWDSPVLFHEASSNCDVTTVGELFGRSSYGIGMPKGSPWSNNISLAILELHQSGTMEEFEKKWIKFGDCPVKTHTTTLGLNHMLGVFIMVAGGIGAGIIIVILEVLYYKQKGWRKQQQKVLEKTAQHWQEKVKQRKSIMGNTLTNDQHPMRLQTPNGSICVFENGLKVNGLSNHSNRSASNISSLFASTNNPVATSDSNTGEATNTNCEDTS